MHCPIDRRAGYELAHFGEAIGDPGRAAMLIALIGGVAMPASELARVAGVAPSTATSHLKHLATAGLVVVRPQGRHRYFALTGAHVADAVERLATLRARPTERARVPDDGFSIARTCYGHLAGAVAVAFWTRAREHGWVRWTGESVTLTPKGHATLTAQGLLIDPDLPITGKSCLDWSERLPHVSGQLGVAVGSSFLERGWLRRVPGGRTLIVTERGRGAMKRLGVRWRPSSGAR